MPIMSRIECDFELFKLTAMKDELIVNKVKRLHPDKQASDALFNELSRAANITEFIDTSERHRVPIERLLYEWDYIPAEDSSKHILMLNNDCLQIIFRKLTDAGDYLSAAETCRHFQANVKQCPYPSNFKSLTLSDEDKLASKYHGLSLKRAPNFLQLFGHLIESLELIHDDDDDDTLYIIAQYCAKTLVNLDIKGHEHTTYNLNVLREFKVLESISISSISMDDSVLPRNIKRLKLHDVQTNEYFGFIMKKFPELIAADFYKVKNLIDTPINAFIKLNSQIEELCIVKCPKVTSSLFTNIRQRIPDIKRLEFEFSKEMTLMDYDDMLLTWSPLQELKHLNLIFNLTYEFTADFLLGLLVTNAPTIESLYISGLCHIFEETANRLVEMKELKKVEIRCNPLFDISIDSIVNLIRGLPGLKDITFLCKRITAAEIAHILAYSRRLTNLVIFMRDMHIRSSGYNSILELIEESQLNLEIWRNTGMNNIYENIFMAKDQRLFL